MKKKRKSHGLYKPRFRKDDHVHNVQAAIIRWIRANGGTILMGGGVSIMDLSGFNYFVGMKCNGRKPEKSNDKI